MFLYELLPSIFHFYGQIKAMLIKFYISWEYHVFLVLFKVIIFLNIINQVKSWTHFYHALHAGIKVQML